jgi:hypothetical protein
MVEAAGIEPASKAWNRFESLRISSSTLWRPCGAHLSPPASGLWPGLVRFLADPKIPLDTYDFIEDATHEGRKLRMLVMIEEFSRECLAIVVARRLQSKHVLECLSDLFVERGTPAYIRSACYVGLVKS